MGFRSKTNDALVKKKRSTYNGNLLHLVESKVVEPPKVGVPTFDKRLLDLVG